MMVSEMHRWGRLLAGLGIAVCVVILVVSAVAVRPLHTYELVSLCVLASLLVGGGIVAVLVALATEREQAAGLEPPEPQPEPSRPVEAETVVLSSAPRTGPRERPAGPPPGYPPPRVTFQPGQGPGAMAAYLSRLDRIITRMEEETWARDDSRRAVLEGLIMARRAAQESSRGLVAARQPDGGTRP